MDTLENKSQERNREIGQVLREARQKKDISVATCAKLIHTSRRRYAAVEQGLVGLTITELEALMNFLEVPSHTVWPRKNSFAPTRKVVLKALPGETLQIEVDVED